MKNFSGRKMSFISSMRNKNLLPCLLLLCLFITACSNKEQVTYITHFEKTGGTETDNYDNTIAYCHLLADNLKEVSYESTGFSGQQREIPLLIVDENGSTDVQQIKKSGKIIVLLESCIHPGEPNGKDAGFLLIRDMLVHGNNKDLLKDITILFLPVISPDGLADFSPYNRINQNGPVDMGWRVTAQGYNLNRDFMKLDTPEIKAFVEMFNKWEPDFFFDTHATNGADYQYVSTYMIEDNSMYDRSIGLWLETVWEPSIVSTMESLNTPVCRYITFSHWGNPTTPLLQHSSSPMFSQAYAASRNCPAVLLETHMLKPYKDRVISTYNIVLETMRLLRDDKTAFIEMLTEAKEHDRQLKSLPVNYELNYYDTSFVDFLGYEFHYEKSEITGGDYVVYDRTKPIVKRQAVMKTNMPTKFLPVPKQYIIPVQYDKVIDIVKRHGFPMTFLEDEREFVVDKYVFSDVVFSETPYEGHQRVRKFNSMRVKDTMSFPKGSAVVSTDCNGIRLLMNLLEPEMTHSLFEFGYFNNILQRNEYFEIYKMENTAKEMLQNDTALVRKYHEMLLASDAAMSPENRQYTILQWFYQNSPYWDKNYNIYPIGIVE